MKTKWRMMLAMALLVGACGTAEAHRWHRCCRPHRVVAVVARPAATVRVVNCFTQKERLAMAVAYLDAHEYLTVKRYARIANLTKATAEAELDAFARNGELPVTAVVKGKRKVYVKSN